ncbi:hypothetical protein KDH_19390 [Dictyobacter sp. S3.2.2.5]|uniref:Na/Pi cotransporter n=1 Tax=Dictyobacter halimunensis TaxID=3026934 RepID=A0ABQ6FN24_9CHLR|nr:hypothetical protein KDH_19390 [Dictyobacter sp. S3.2.2.5]
MILVLHVTLALGKFWTGVVLVLYGVRLITEAVRHVADTHMRGRLTSLMRYPVIALIVGMIVTALMQSSNAMSSLLVGFVSTDLLSLSEAIAVLLGSNIGSTLAVQCISLHVTEHVFIFIGIAATVALWTHRTPYRYLGRLCFAFGVIMFGLSELVTASAPLVTYPVIIMILQALATVPIVLFVCGALLTILLNSSTAFIGLVIMLATTGALPTSAALALMLGANVRTTVMALFLAMHEGTITGRRLAVVHFGTKLAGALIALIWLVPLTAVLSHLWTNAGTRVAMAHLGLNILIALFFLPLICTIERLMQHWMPERPEPKDTLLAQPKVLPT